MKKFGNILFLSALLLGIIFIWLIPKTNGEKKTQYVRVYTKEREQTIVIEADSGKTDKSTEDSRKEKRSTKKAKPEREIIQTDTLNGTIKMKDIKPSLYSRGMHFRRAQTIEVELDTVSTKIDSANTSINY
jgi:hypothetical protein